MFEWTGVTLGGMLDEMAVKVFPDRYYFDDGGEAKDTAKV